MIEFKGKEDKKMQLKIYKRSTFYLFIVLLIDTISILFLYKNRELFADKKPLVITIFVLFFFLLLLIYSHYDLNADRNYILKKVRNGDVALAKINGGTFVRFARNARLKNHVYWKLDVEIYDNDMNKIQTSIIEKFNLKQTTIPKGYVYVTYDENKAEDSLIIPNMIISSINEYSPLVEEYENKIKPKYLNAYINDGLILQTYDETIKQSKENSR